MISEEEYFREKRLRKFWLILFPVLMLPGVFSFVFFVLGLIFPELYVKDQAAPLFKFTMTAFIPVVMVSVIGLIVFLLGLKRSFFQLKLGLIIMLIASITFIPYTADYFITLYNNLPVNYSELTNEELKELADEDNDKIAERLLKQREAKAELAYYRKLNNPQLYNLWKVNGDSKAYDEFNRRLLLYRVERIKYNRLSGEELLRKYEQEKDQLAWFEIETRKRRMETGEEDPFE